jgi:hypothetical protein
MPILKLNSENTARGNNFRDKCKVELEYFLNEKFEKEVSLELEYGKQHKFDLVSKNRLTVAECKAFSWTYPGQNVPAAKITTLRESIQYLKAFPGAKKRYLIIKKDLHPRTEQSLAAYFVRLNKGLIGEVTVVEMSETGGELCCLCGIF